MSKKKKAKKIDSYICKVIMQDMFGNGGITHLPINNKDGDYFQQVEETEKQHEQEQRLHVLSEMVMLAKLSQDNQKEIQKVRKFIKESERMSAVHDKFAYDIKKHHKKNSKKTDKLHKTMRKQATELQECHKQLEQMKKIICLMALYLDIGSASGDLHKIQKKLSKKLEKGNKVCLIDSQQGKVVEGKYREI